MLVYIVLYEARYRKIDKQIDRYGSYSDIILHIYIYIYLQYKNPSHHIPSSTIISIEDNIIYHHIPTLFNSIDTDAKDLFLKKACCRHGRVPELLTADSLRDESDRQVHRQYIDIETILMIICMCVLFVCMIL